MSLPKSARLKTAYAAFWVMTRRVTILAACVDVLFFGFFLWADAPFLAWLNVASVALYILANRLLRWRWNRTAILLIWLEVMGHASIGTLLLGWDAGFNYYLLLFIPAIMVSLDWPAAAFPLGLLFVIYLGLHILSNRVGPIEPIDAVALEILNIFNVMVFFSMASYTARFYYLIVRRSEARLRTLATRDELTDLFNRRHLLELGEAELARSQREDRPLSLIIVDIDYFKQINDSFGHDVGDRVLVQVGELFRACCRTHDTVARWGGEEFLFLLPETGTTAAADFAERVRVLVADGGLDHEDDRVACTVSVGVASPVAGETLDTVINRADRALYQSKLAGRNRVTVASRYCADPPPQASP